jgi:hypothetical protein
VPRPCDAVHDIGNPCTENPSNDEQANAFREQIHILITRTGSPRADKLNMEYSGTSLIADAAQMLALAIAFAAALVAAAVYWRQRSTVLGVQREGLAQPPANIIYNDPPTVRMIESQRVDRLRKVVQLGTGAYVDILECPAGDTPRFRITLKSVLERAESAVAHIAVEFRGTPVSCGPLVQEIAFNEFVLPRTLRDEPRSAVFHYHERGDALDFMRIKVRSLDLQAQTAEIDVMQVLGHWPTGN